MGPLEEVFRPLLCPEDIYQCGDLTRRVGHKGRDGFKWASPIPSRPFLRTCAAEINMVSRKWSVLVCQVSCHTCLVLLALSSWTVVLFQLGLRHRCWALLAHLLWEVILSERKR